jgi:hypothetical protein
MTSSRESTQISSNPVHRIRAKMSVVPYSSLELERRGRSQTKARKGKAGKGIAGCPAQQRKRKEVRRTGERESWPQRMIIAPGKQLTV